MASTVQTKDPREEAVKYSRMAGTFGGEMVLYLLGLYFVVTRGLSPRGEYSATIDTQHDSRKGVAVGKSHMHSRSTQTRGCGGR